MARLAVLFGFRHSEFGFAISQGGLLRAAINMPAPRLFNCCLLRPSDFEPSQADLEVIGAFNPGAVKTEQGVVLLVRVAEQVREKRERQMGLPRWDPETNRVVI